MLRIIVGICNVFNDSFWYTSYIRQINNSIVRYGLKGLRVNP